MRLKPIKTSADPDGRCAAFWPEVGVHCAAGPAAIRRTLQLRDF